MMFEVSSIAREKVLQSINRKHGDGSIIVNSDGVIIRTNWSTPFFKASLQGETFLTLRLNLPKFYTGLEAQMLTFPQTKEAIWAIVDYFDLPPNQAVLHNIEIFLDVEIGYSVKSFLEFFKYYKTCPISQTRTSAKYKGSLECQFTAMRLKLYDVNAVHFNQPGNKLRVESHFNKMQAVSDRKIYLSDLYEKSFHETQLSKLIKRFNNYLIIEDINRSKIPSEDKTYNEMWCDLQFLKKAMTWPSIRRKRWIQKLDFIQYKYGIGYKQKILKKLKELKNDSLLD